MSNKIFPTDTTRKTTPVAADQLLLADSADSNKVKDITLDQVAELVIDQGVFSTVTVGENVAAGDALYMKSDGKYWIADADAVTTMPAVVIAAETIAADASGKVIHSGYITDGTWSWTVGALLYVSVTGTTTNTLTETAPSGTGDQVQVVGYAESATKVYFDPSFVLVEIA